MNIIKKALQVLVNLSVIVLFIIGAAQMTFWLLPVPFIVYALRKYDKYKAGKLKKYYRPFTPALET